MGESRKRKQGGFASGRSKKRKHASQRGGPDHRHSNKDRIEALKIDRGFVEAGDVGIWVTCARGQEGKAAREVTTLFDDYVQRLYSIRLPDETNSDDGGDIADSIEKELSTMRTEKSNPSRPFTIIRVNVECVLFVRTSDPIEPVGFCKAICSDIEKSAGSPGCWVSRYLNRITPVTYTCMATEAGIDDLGRGVLAQHFELNPKSESVEPKMTETSQGVDGDQDKSPHSFAIRPSFRNHTTLKRDALIQQIAKLINGKKHRVNLSTPDKVILVDVYEAFACMSVVDGDWEQLHRYNLSELFRPKKRTQEEAQKSGNKRPDDAAPESTETTGEKATGELQTDKQTGGG